MRSSTSYRPDAIASCRDGLDAGYEEMKRIRLILINNEDAYSIWCEDSDRLPGNRALANTADSEW